MSIHPSARVATLSALALVWVSASAPLALADTSSSGPVAGHVLVCDTAEEVEAVLTSGADDMAARLTQVNDRSGKQACNIVTAIFYEGDNAKTVLSTDGAVRIIQIDVIGLQSDGAWMRLAKPTPQFAGVLEDAIGV